MIACFVAHSHRLSTLSLCLESLQSRTLSNLKLHHKIHRKFFSDRNMPPPPLANGALCLSTPKHNGKSGRTGTTERFLTYREHDILPLWSIVRITVLFSDNPIKRHSIIRHLGSSVGTVTSIVKRTVFQLFFS
jgi:hypothetical protein